MPGNRDEPVSARQGDRLSEVTHLAAAHVPRAAKRISGRRATRRDSTSSATRSTRVSRLARQVDDADQDRRFRFSGARRTRRRPLRRDARRFESAGRLVKDLSDRKFQSVLSRDFAHRRRARVRRGPSPRNERPRGPAGARLPRAGRRASVPKRSYPRALVRALEQSRRVRPSVETASRFASCSPSGRDSGLSGRVTEDLDRVALPGAAVDDRSGRPGRSEPSRRCRGGTSAA